MERGVETLQGSDQPARLNWVIFISEAPVSVRRPKGRPAGHRVISMQRQGHDTLECSSLGLATSSVMPWGRFVHLCIKFNVPVLHFLHRPNACPHME